MKSLSMTLALVAALGLTQEVQAQQTMPDDAETELRLLATQGTPADRDREAVQRFLDRDDVETTASRFDVDIDRVRDGVRTLDDSEATTLADRIEGLQDGLDDQVGGNTFVISSTTIIIVLLVIILVAVA